jgi:hypothetical protein
MESPKCIKLVINLSATAAMDANSSTALAVELLPKVQPTDDTMMTDVARKVVVKRPFPVFKTDTCRSFEAGVKILEGTDALHDHHGVAMQLTAQAYGKSWQDGNRVAGQGECFGTATNSDTFGALAEDMVNGCTSDMIMQNQALCISVGNTRDKVEVHAIHARGLLVFVGVGKDVEEDKRMVQLYSADYYEAFAEYYCMAGGVFTGPKSLEDGANISMVKCAKTGETPAEIDAKILGNTHVWKHPDARGWAHHHYACGLTSDTLIWVNRQSYVMPECSFAIVTRTYGTNLMKLSSTSSGMFSLEMGNNCYSNRQDAIRNCSGVWKKNATSGKIEMCGIKLVKSDTKFTLDNVSKMAVEEEVKQDDAQDATDDVMEEVEATAVNKKVPLVPSTGLYPFVGNTSLRGVYVATLSTGYRKIPVPKVYAVNRNLTRGPTRGGGGRTIIRSPSPETSEDEDEDMPDDTELSFPIMEAGTALYEMKGLPAYDCNKMELLKPNYTILDVLVYAPDDEVSGVALSKEEEDAKSVQLVKAVAEQIRNFNKMTTECAQATISDIATSALLVKKADLTEKDLASLAATKAINDNASHFFGL